MPYSERFDDALVFASRLHREHERKGRGTPYINHLLIVAGMVGTHGGTEDQVIAALLHDAIEDMVDDIPDIAEQIGERFGENVLDIVQGCTDADTHPKPPWRERKKAYIDRLRGLPKGDPVLLVSNADKLHNARSILRDLRTIGDELWERFTGGRDETLWYYESLADVYLHKEVGYLAEELRRVVDAMVAESNGS